jgi:TPR repeat protein
MPKDAESLPEDLRFLCWIDNITLPEDYRKSPFDELLKSITSRPEKDDIFRDTYNCNCEYDVDMDFKNTLSDAENGSYKAMFTIATMYFYGMSSETGESVRNFEKAYYWLEKLTQIENEYSLYADSMIGEMYYHGLIPRRPQSYEKALMYHDKAQSKSGFSAREYAYLHSRGCGCDFDYKSIENHYLKAIEQGDNVAVEGLAQLYMTYGQYRKAAEIYQQTCNYLPDSKFRLGMLYREGVLADPPCPDYFKAAFYFLDAISHGDCKAEVYHELGRLYFTPTGGFPKDFRLAQKYFIIAADKGIASAQYKLGLMYEYGYVEKNIEKAIYYHTLASKQGQALSAYHLALLYQQPESKNYHKAFQYASIAAKCGVMEGEFVLATLLHMGRGCVADCSKAYIYYERAYEHGMTQAKNMMDKINSRS